MRPPEISAASTIGPETAGTSKLDGARHRLANETLSSLAGKTLHLP
jgi:hypothetical protein